MQSELPANDFSALLGNLRPGRGKPLDGPDIYSSVLGGGAAMFDRPLLPRAAFPDKAPRDLADNIHGRAERVDRDTPDSYPFRVPSAAVMLTRTNAP